jgi:hypothetical protein
MKIAQVTPPWESVPPKCYGETERIVSYLTEALARLGHDVTLFASGDPPSVPIRHSRRRPVFYQRAAAWAAVSLPVW